MASKEHLQRLQNFVQNLGVDLGEALMMVVRVFNWQWADPSHAEDFKAKGIPDDKIDQVIDFFRCNYRTRYKIIAPLLHKQCLEQIKEYRRDYQLECEMNQGKPWELRIPRQ